MRLTVRTIGERGVIERAKRRLRADASVLLGIGDDAAAVRAPRERALLLASDMLVEGVHFRLRGRGAVSPRDLGWKALAVNVSDIAAMGGTPRWAVVSLGAPASTPVRVTDGIADGLQRCAARFGMSVVGGDTVRAPRLVIDVAITGSADPDYLARRDAAKVGEAVYVTGRLGGSYPSGRHARFTPRVTEARALVRRYRVRAMMDLSDGLASDLWQMSRASRVVFRVEAERIPVAAGAGNVYHALVDGEDFELLFTSRKPVPDRIGGCRVTRIGRVVRRGVGVELVQAGGRVRPLTLTGFEHF
jgi:thiamine-monophosphate kinase